MLDQMGPQRLWNRFKLQAPRYAKILPIFHEVLHQYLSKRGTGSDNEALCSKSCYSSKKQQTACCRPFSVAASVL